MEKTNKQTNDVILYDNRVVVFKVENDVMLYVVGSADENEVLLYNVVVALRDALGILFKYVPPSPLRSRLISTVRRTLLMTFLEEQPTNAQSSKTTTSSPSL